MLSASCFFRGSFMNGPAAQLLVANLCAVPRLIPEYWNVVEPVDVPFNVHDHNDVISAMSPPPAKAIRTLLFFARDSSPKFLASVDLRLWHYQGTTAHNSIAFEGLTRDEDELVARYLTASVLPDFPGYASIPDWTKDSERYRELKRSCSGKELNQLFANRRIILPFGPYGCLGDIHWFNYFGSIYVDLIGRRRLLEAGWARVDEVGGGFACYASRKLDDADGPRRRLAIVKALEEFVWTPGCKPEEKRTPTFDFPQQLAAIPPDVASKLIPASRSNMVSFSGLSPDEQERALRAVKHGPEGK